MYVGVRIELCCRILYWKHPTAGSDRTIGGREGIVPLRGLSFIQRNPPFYEQLTWMLGQDSKSELPPTQSNVHRARAAQSGYLLRSSRNPSGNIAEPFLQDMARWNLGASISSSSKCVWWSILDSCGRGKCSRLNPLWKSSNFGGNMSQSHSHGCEGAKTELVKLYLNTSGQILDGHYILVHLVCRSRVCIQREPIPIANL